MPSRNGADAQRFWVVGTAYSDPQLRRLIAGSQSRYGPFDDYEAAKAEWARHAWRTVDDCTQCFRIERIDPSQPPPGTD